MRPNFQTQRAAFVPRRAAFLPLLQVAFVCGLLTASAHETNYQVIKVLDGLGPTALIEGKDGNLYGTLHTAGEKAEGVVFKLKKDGSGYKVLHHFTGCRGGGDGSNPHGLVEGSDGALYGTTKYGGTPGRTPGSAFEGPGISDLGNGTVFKVNKDGNDYSVLHSFTCRDGDGSMPYAGVVEGRDGGLYGSTGDGGDSQNGRGYSGTVFKLNKDGSGYKVLYTFGGCLRAGSDGALYGGAYTVFKLNLDGSGYRPLPGFARAAGGKEASSVIQGRDGDLYGTTSSGGTDDAGTVFKLSKDGSSYKVLHNLMHDAEGMGPQGLAQGSDGSLYGTTEYRGINGGGSAYKLNPDGSGFTVLHSFPVVGDATNPQGTLLRGSDGALYGMANSNGTNDNHAVVFRLSSSAAPPKPSPASK